MGNLCQGEQDPEKKKSKQWDKFLNKEKKKQDTEVKILLLGAGESGKSTIFKQMKILHATGYTEDARIRFKSIIYGNTLNAIRALIGAMDPLKINYESETNRAIANQLADIPEQEVILNANQLLTPERGQQIQQLWRDAGIKKAFSQSHRFQLSDSAGYYLDSIHRMIHPDYIPTIEDVLRSRVKTVGIVDADFVHNGYKFKMIDVGGQRSERRKWMHVFDDVTAIIFITSLSEYNQVLLEDETVNRMHESLELFEEICQCSYFTDTPLVIFFNKEDLFRSKLEEKIDLKQCFPEYKGKLEFDEAYKYIEEKFLEKNQNPQRVIFPHPTTATNTKNIENVFNDIKHILFMEAIDEFV